MRIASLGTRWFSATFVILCGVECTNANCSILPSATDVQLTFQTREVPSSSVTDAVNTTTAAWVLYAVGSWRRPTVGNITRYGVLLDTVPNRMTTSVVGCAYDPQYTRTTDESFTFEDVTFGFHYQFNVRTVDVINNDVVMQRSNAAMATALSPDCYETTKSVEFCSGLDVQTTSKPVDLRKDDATSQPDGKIRVAVSWIRPVQHSGKLGLYNIMYKGKDTGTNRQSIPATMVTPVGILNEQTYSSLYPSSIVFKAEAPDTIQQPTNPSVFGADVRIAAQQPRRDPMGPAVQVSSFTPSTSETTNPSTTLMSGIKGTAGLSDSSGTTPLFLTGSLVAGLALALLLGAATLAWTCFRRKKKEDDLKKAVFIRTREEEISMYHHKEGLHKDAVEDTKDCHPDFDMKELDRTLLKLEKELGSGQFGIVYKGFVLGLKNKEEYSPVAVKSLKCNATLSMKEDFLDEIRLIIEIGSHPNILSVLGCCTVDEPYYLITEFMSYGDLLHFLWKCREEDRPEDDPLYILTETNKIQIARQITRGMEYLSNTRYYHGDLAARNVLVGEGLVVKISDFGLADDIYQNGYKRLAPQRKRPVKWVSLETNVEGRCTIQSDVWSFGIVLYEIYTLGRMPYPGLDGHEVLRRLQTGYRMDKPDTCPYDIFDIMKQCWKGKPSDRPTFTNLFNTFDKMLVEQCDYMLPLEGVVYDHCISVAVGGAVADGAVATAPAAATEDDDERNDEARETGFMATDQRLEMTDEDVIKCDTNLSDTTRLFQKEKH